MQVSVETGEGTERTLKIQVPAETLNQEVENRLKSMSGNVKIHGFRPGKVPLKVVKQHYGTQIFQEVAGEMIQNTFRDALTQENLNPAGDPVINAQSMQLGEPLEYTATFDVIEPITLSPISDIKLERLEAEVLDADVDDMIETLRKQRLSWNEEDRAAEDGDKVTISFKGTVDGEPFAGGDAENVPVVIGSGSMIPGFEDQLTGLSKAGNTTIKTKFPDDYNAEEFAGKDVEFSVEVQKVESPTLPDVDEEFVKVFGVEDGNVETLKQEINANMRRELDNRIRTDLKMKVMDQLIENNQLDVPGSIVQEEAQALQKQTAASMQTAEQPIESFISDATRRVKLGIILAEVAKTAQLTVDPDMVKNRVELMSSDYSDPAEFVKHYYSNPELLRSVENLVMEDAVVDWIVNGAAVTNVKTTFKELTNPAK